MAKPWNRKTLHFAQKKFPSKFWWPDSPIVLPFYQSILFSRRASRRWARLSENEKKPWHDLAEQDKQAHKAAFPGYRYCPRRSNTAAMIASQNAVKYQQQQQDDVLYKSISSRV